MSPQTVSEIQALKHFDLQRLSDRHQAALTQAAERFTHDGYDSINAHERFLLRMFRFDLPGLQAL